MPSAAEFGVSQTPVKWLLVMMSIEFAGFAMLIPVMPFFLIKELHLGPSEVGKLMSAFSLAQIIGAASCGRLSDSLGRRGVIIGVFTWAAFGCMATAVVTTLAQMCCVRILQGLSGGTSAMVDAYLLDATVEEERAPTIGLATAVKSASFVIGPAIGAALISIGLSRRHIFLVAGSLALLAATLGLRFLEESLPKWKRRPLCFGGVEDVPEARTAVADWEAVNFGLVCIWCSRFASALAQGFMFSTYAFLIKDNFGWNDRQFGMVLFGTSIASGCVQLFVFPSLAAQFGPRVCLLVGAALGVVSFLFVSTGVLLVHCVALAFFAVSVALSEPAVTVLVGDFVNDRHLGFATGVTRSFHAVATMLSPLVAGGMYKQNQHLPYLAGAACYGCAALAAGALLAASRPEPSEAVKLLPPKTVL